MDAAYLINTLGSSLAKGCAATIAAAPTDPIQYLSLWLLKYVENKKIERDFWKQKDLQLQAQLLQKQKQSEAELCERQHQERQSEAIDKLRFMQHDPYLLFGACLQAVSSFTECTSAYVALVLDKPWEPAGKSLGKEGDETGENEAEPEQEKEEEKEQESLEEQQEEEQEEAKGSSEMADNVVSMDDGSEQSKGTNQGARPKKKGKPKNPLNYKKKILLYVSATQNNGFMVNKQLTGKLGPVTYSLLLKGMTRLHIVNVLYEEGIHYFQGIPRIGAYFSAPISLSTDPVQVVALLCLDTLKKEDTGHGKPFSSKEQEFIVAVANVAGEALSKLHSSTSFSYKTKAVMKELEAQNQQIEASHKDQLRRERAVSKSSLSPQEKKPNAEESSKSEKQKDEDEEMADRTERDTKDTDANDYNAMHDEVEDENKDDEVGDNSVLDSEGEEGAGEEVDGHGEEIDSEEEESEIHVVEKDLKRKQKRMVKLERNFKICHSRFEKQAIKVAKLEKQLKRSAGALCHLRLLLATVFDMAMKYKDEELLRVKQYLFPPTTIYRIFKALLLVLGYANIVIDDWTKSRETITSDLFIAMQNYNPFTENDLEVWKLTDMYINGITEDALASEAPIGYLGYKWLLAANKVAVQSIKHETLKAQNEKATKDFADVELEQMVAEIDLRVAIDEERKAALHLEDLQSKHAREIAMSSGLGANEGDEVDSEDAGNEE